MSNRITPEYRRQRKAAGFCTCGRKAKPGKWRCEDCTVRTAEWMNQRYWRNVARGLCTTCGVNKVEKFRDCATCRTRAAESRNRRRQEKRNNGK